MTTFTGNGHWLKAQRTAAGLTQEQLAGAAFMTRTHIATKTMVEHTITDASTLHGWRKSSFSGGNYGSCVEVIDGHPLGVPVRDSVHPQGPALLVRREAFSSLITAIKG